MNSAVTAASSATGRSEVPAAARRSVPVQRRSRRRLERDGAGRRVEPRLGPDGRHGRVRLGVVRVTSTRWPAADDPLDDGGDLLGVLPDRRRPRGSPAAGPGGGRRGEAQVLEGERRERAAAASARARRPRATPARAALEARGSIDLSRRSARLHDCAAWPFGARAALESAFSRLRTFQGAQSCPRGAMSSGRAMTPP